MLDRMGRRPARAARQPGSIEGAGSGARALLREVGQHDLGPAVVGSAAQQGSEGARAGGRLARSRWWAAGDATHAIPPAAAAAAANTSTPSMPPRQPRNLQWTAAVAAAALTRAPARPATPPAACSRLCMGRHGAVRHLQHQSTAKFTQVRHWPSRHPPNNNTVASPHPTTPHPPCSPHPTPHVQGLMTFVRNSAHTLSTSCSFWRQPSFI